MDMRQLELFVAAAEEQHFTRAARRANIVQSGLSAAIRGLEDELGTRLFVRSTRRVELSEVGKIFLPEARRVLAAAKRARERVAAVKGALIGRLSIGMGQLIPSALDLPALLQDFRTRHPQVEIVLRETYLDALADGLREGKIDLAFMPVTGVAQAGLSLRVFFSSPMVLAVPPRHRLARGGSEACVALSELRDEPFIDFSPRWGTRQLVDRIFLREGVTRQIAFEVENIQLLMQFVRRGFGVAVVPRIVLENQGLAAASLMPSEKGATIPTWDFAMFRAEAEGDLTANPAADIFRRMVEEAAEPVAPA